MKKKSLEINAQEQKIIAVTEPNVFDVEKDAAKVFTTHQTDEIRVESSYFNGQEPALATNNFFAPESSRDLIYEESPSPSHSFGTEDNENGC